MKKTLLMVALVGLIAAPALAGVQNPYPGRIQATLDTQNTSRAVLSYDNWTNPSSLYLGNYTMGALLGTQTNEIGDDLHLTTPGLLDTMGFSVANGTGASNLTGGTGAIFFYDSNFDPIFDVPTGLYNGFGFTLPALSIPINSGSRISFGAGALASIGFVLPQDVIVTTIFDSITWDGAGTLADVAVQIRGPINVGTSADIMYDLTASTSFSFGGSPLANMAYKLSTPEPMTIVLLGFGALALIRRR